MSDTNAEIAELLGWTPTPEGLYTRDPSGLSGMKFKLSDLPNYIGSRDAIIGAVETLPEEQQDAIIQHLYETVEREHLAIASEWCAAFLAVMRKEAKP